MCVQQCLLLWPGLSLSYPFTQGGHPRGTVSSAAGPAGAPRAAPPGDGVPQAMARRPAHPLLLHPPPQDIPARLKYKEFPNTLCTPQSLPLCSICWLCLESPALLPDPCMLPAPEVQLNPCKNAPECPPKLQEDHLLTCPSASALSLPAALSLSVVLSLSAALSLSL